MTGAIPQEQMSLIQQDYRLVSKSPKDHFAINHVLHTTLVPVQAFAWNLSNLSEAKFDKCIGSAPNPTPGCEKC